MLFSNSRSQKHLLALLERDRVQLGFAAGLFLGRNRCTGRGRQPGSRDSSAPSLRSEGLPPRCRSRLPCETALGLRPSRANATRGTPACPDCANHNNVAGCCTEGTPWFSSLLAGEHRDGLGELRQLLLPVLLEKTLPADTVRHPDHRQRSVGQCGSIKGETCVKVAQQIALGQRGLLQGCIRRPVRPGPDVVSRIRCGPTISGKLGPLVVELRQNGLDLGGQARSGGTGPSDSPGPNGGPASEAEGRRRAPHRPRIDVIPQPREYRLAQAIVLGPAVKFHFGDELGLDPGRRVGQLRLRGRTGPVGRLSG